MSVIIIQKRRSGGVGDIPEGGEILWYGIAADVPADWAIDVATEDVFVKGCAAGNQSDLKYGGATHLHTNPASVNTVAAHTHGITGTLNSAVGSVEYFQSGSGGVASAGHGHGSGSGTSGSGGSHGHTMSAPASAEIYPPYHRLYWIVAQVETELPVGGIVMWDDTLANLAISFGDKLKVCDGGNGTIDLKDKFIYGAAEDVDIGAGGNLTHVHTNSDTGSGGTHTHSQGVTSGGASSSARASGYAGTGVSVGGHTHGLSVTSDADANHTHTIGNTLPASTRPPYLKLFFAMRTE